MARGSCLCGKVQYEVSGKPKWMAHCHCSMCRKHHGSLFMTTLGVDPGNFRWLSGQDAIAHYRSSAAFTRPFCRHCGSALPEASADAVICPAGTLAGDVGAKPQVHIFAKSKSPMHAITDSLTQFDEYPPGYGTAVETKAEPAPDDGTIRGSCLCGDVAFEIDTRVKHMINCHCSRCRRSRGAAHGTNVFAKTDMIRWTRGREQVVDYKVPDAKMFATAFCRRCGSLLPAPFERTGMSLVPVGVLDSVLHLRPCVHIHVGSKAPWFDISDALPQFDEMPPKERLSEFFW
jgi:hypothetical protein